MTIFSSRRYWKQTFYLAGSAAGVLTLAWSMAKLCPGGEIASWVQAIGSIAAIAGAYHAGDRQASRAIRDRLSSYLAIYAAAHERAQLAEDIFAHDDKTRHKRGMEYDHSQINGILKAMDAVPLPELGSADAVIAALAMRDQLYWLMGNIDQFRTPLDDEATYDTETRAAIREGRISACSQNVMMRANAIRENYKILKRSISA